MSKPSIPSAGELKRLFAERGIRPSRARGQNFLVDAALMRLVAQEARLSGDEVVLEPGAGTGALTSLLAEKAGAVVAVEVDPKLYEIARERVGGLPNVRLIHTDVMGPGESISPVVAAGVRAALEAAPGRHLKIAANLPFSISTAFIGAVLLEGPEVREMVVTVQKEVAERLRAGPGDEAYGYLSVVVQAVASVELLRRMKPHAFWPRPEVESQLVRIRPDPQRRAELADPGRLKRVAGALFRYRRKQLGGSLVLAGIADSREEARRMLDVVGAPETARCEELTVSQFIKLAGLLP